MIKKILKYTFLIFLTYIALYIIFFNIKQSQINKTNTVINNYQYKNEYQKTYALKEYVSESLESYPIFRRFILESMFSYESLVGQSNLLSSGVYAVQNYFVDEYDYVEQVRNLQYKEEHPIKLIEDECIITNEVNYVCQYKYRGEIPEKEGYVEGDVSLFANGGHNLVVSLKDDNGEISKEQTRLLSDDSTSELLTYLIIEQVQTITGKKVNPDAAAQSFYGNTIEQLAGSISYHAVIAYILAENDIQDEERLYEKVEEVNITKKDNDSFFVNRSY